MSFYSNKEPFRGILTPDGGKRPNSYSFRPGVKSMKMTPTTPYQDSSRERPGMLNTPVINPLQFKDSSPFHSRNDNNPYAESVKYAEAMSNSWGQEMDEVFGSDRFNFQSENSIADKQGEKRKSDGLSVRTTFSGPNRIVPQFDRKRFQEQSLHQQLKMASQKKQTVLNTETPTLTYRLKEKKEQLVSEAYESFADSSLPSTPQKMAITRRPTVYPKWRPDNSAHGDLKDNLEGLSFPRVFTVTIQKLQSWPKVLTGGKVIIELFGIMDQVEKIVNPKAKRFILKGIPKGTVQCIFYEIDRELAVTVKGQWQRCIGIIRLNGEFQCLSLRPASKDELKNLDLMVTLSSKATATLLRAINET